MLYLDKPIGPIHGFTVYRDNEDTSYYYYIRERPRLAINDGIAEFLFLKYRRDLTDNPTLDPSIKQSLGGGFLSFTVDLGADEQELAALKRGLAEFADGDINL